MRRRISRGDPGQSLEESGGGGAQVGRAIGARNGGKVEQFGYSRVQIGVQGETGGKRCVADGPTYCA